MASHIDSVSMALFCDFENVALGVRDAKYEKFDIKPVLERLLLKGSIVVKKAYCDWERYKTFKAAMHEANFELIEIPHVRQSGKNSADIRLVVDALDLCYTKAHVDTFVIISGDSDFSPLVSKLRENAKNVIGVGVKQSTSDLLIANCDEFIFYDDLVRESQRTARRGDSKDAATQGRRSHEEERRRREEVERRRAEAIELAAITFEALVAERGDTGKIWASVLKEAIKRRRPDFNEAHFGFKAFGNLLEEAQARGLLEIGRDEKSNTFVLRPAAPAATPVAPPPPESVPSAVEPAPTPAEPAAEPAASTPKPARRGGRGRKSAQAAVPAAAAAPSDSPGAAEPPAKTEAPEAAQAAEPADATAPEAAPAAEDPPKPAARRRSRKAGAESPPATVAAAPEAAAEKTPAPKRRRTRSTKAAPSA